MSPHVGAGRSLLVATLAIGLTLAPATLQAQQSEQSENDSWFGRDKALHFGATFALAGAGYGGAALLSREPVVRFGVGATLAMGAGLAKEMIDRTSGGHPSLRDVGWDALGTATGLLSAWLVDRYIFSRPRP